MKELDALIALFNAALEHCQPNTAKLLGTSASELFKKIGEKLPKDEAPKE